MRTVAAIPATALIVGSAVGLVFSELPALPFVIALIASAAGSLMALYDGRPRTLAIPVAVAFFAGGDVLAVRAWREAWRPTLRNTFEALARVQRAAAAAEHRLMPEDDEAFAVVEGVLRQDATSGAAGVSLTADVDVACGAGPWPSACDRVNGGVLATVVGSEAGNHFGEWRQGRRVRFPVQLRRASRYLDPGVPDYERALARRGTTLVGTVKSGLLVEVLERAAPIDEALAGLRAFSRRAIGQGVGRWSSRSAAIVSAIVTGDRAGLDDDVQRALQNAGTYHVIAISGGNIAILAGLILLTFRWAGMLGPIAMASSIAILVLYARFVGGGASVDRATLMACVYLAARAADQRSPPLNSLAVVAGLLVAAAPLSITDPAFTLTFGATLAILLVAPVLSEVEPKVSAWTHARFGTLPCFHPGLVAVQRAALAMLAASVAAEAMLFPVGALVFSRVTCAGLVLNFLAIPLMALAQIAGMLVIPVAAISCVGAAMAGWVAHLGADGLVRSAQLVELVPIVTWRVHPPEWTVLVAYYVGLSVAWTLWRRRRVVGSSESSSARCLRRAAAGLALVAALWIVLEPDSWLAARGDGRLHVTFIDVGQGDAALVRFPRGTALLVDAGGLAAGSPFDIGDRVVAPVLRAAGIRRLDYIAVTHGDPDHVGGARAVVREFHPREVWVGIPVPRSAILDALHAEAQQRGADWKSVKAGDHIVADDVDIVVRHPPPADWERQKVRNDDSVVLELLWRDVSVLMTGDISRAVERTMVTGIHAVPLRILKVPHHGSLTSSSVEFVQAIAPRVAVFSVGRTNHFGHPAPEVLQRYRDAGTEIFRTDRDGAVMVDTDGYSMSVHGFTGRQLSLP